MTFNRPLDGYRRPSLSCRVLKAANGVRGTHAYGLPSLRTVATFALRRTLYVQGAASSSEWTRAKDDAQWKQAAVLLERLDLEADELDSCLAQAFGWGTQKYWKNEKHQEMPDPLQVMALSDADGR